MGLFQGVQVSRAGLDKLLLMIVPVPFESPYVLFFLLEQLVHLNVVLCQDCTATLIILLVTQLLNLRLSLLSI